MARGGATQLRLFVAIEIPPDAKDAVAEAIEPLRARFPEAHWAPPGNWHVTMKFLGVAEPVVADRVMERLSSVAADVVPFRTCISGVGGFPSTARARVVWVGLEDAPGRIAELALGVSAALSTEFKPESRPFSPHLTVARSDRPLVLPEVVVRSAPFTVGELVLFRSHLRRPAPRYEAIGRFPFGS